MYDSRFDRTRELEEQREQRDEVAIPSFEELCELAERDPLEFEAVRLRLCYDVIDSAPEYLKNRLKGIQFTIDMERKRAKSSYSMCLKISEMMNESLMELTQALTNPAEYRRNYHNERCDVVSLFPKV